MRHDFAPLRHDARMYLTAATRIDFTHADFTLDRWLCCTGRANDGELLGCCVFEFQTWFDAYFSIAIADPRCLTRRVMAACFKAVFSRAVRVTAEVDPANVRAERQARRMGFVYEGFKRLGVEGNRDALQFGMLKADCRLLPGFDPARTSIVPLELGGQHVIAAQSA